MTNCYFLSVAMCVISKLSDFLNNWKKSMLKAFLGGKGGKLNDDENGKTKQKQYYHWNLLLRI